MAESSTAEEKPIPYPIIIADRNTGKYSVQIISQDVQQSNIQTFPEALALFVAYYVNFNIQFMPKVACTVQFVQKVLCKLPVDEGQNALHKKKVTGKNIVAVIMAEDMIYRSGEEFAQVQGECNSLLLFKEIQS